MWRPDRGRKLVYKAMGGGGLVQSGPEARTLEK